MIVSQDIIGLWGGVSQQPAASRLPNQCEAGVNISQSITDGSFKRYPTEFISQLSTSINSYTSYLHTIDRDSSEKYIVLFTGSATEPIEIFDLYGNKKTVNYGHLSDSLVLTVDDSVKNYFSLTSSPPREAFRAVTVADYTLVANHDKVCSMLTSGLEVKPNKAIVYIKLSPPLTGYYLTINGHNLTYTTPGGTSSKTIGIATAFESKISALAIPGISVSRIGSSIFLTADPGVTMNLQVEDEYGDTAIVLLRDSCPSYMDLSPPEWEGFRIKLQHSADQEDAKGYYVQSINGAWVETRGWGQYNTFDASTMPHRIVRLSNGTFAVAPCQWSDRMIGDEDSAPTPSFIGRSINNIVFFRNRLGLLSGDNISFSKAGEYFNFWPFTALEVLDDDPIDISVPSNEVVTLREAIPFNKNLFVRGDFQQFIVGAGDTTFTPKTAMATATTAFNTIPYSQSVSLGSNVYFATPDGPFSRIREYYVQPDTFVEDAADITIHCPRYVTHGELKLISCASTDYVIAFNPDAPRELYVYKFFWAGTEKAQSAWLKWTFDNDVLGICSFASSLYLLIRRGADVCLERMELFRNWTDGLNFKVRLDGLVKVYGTYNSASDVTTWSINYSEPFGDFIVVNHKGVGVPGVTRTSLNTFECKGNLASNPVFIGKPYNSEHTFSSWYIRGENDQAVLNGRLQVRYATLSFDNTGYLAVDINHKSLPSREQSIVCVDVGAALLGEPQVKNGISRFSVQSRNTDVTITAKSSSHYPFRLQGITYEGFYTTQAKQV